MLKICLFGENLWTGVVGKEEHREWGREWEEGQVELGGERDGEKGIMQFEGVEA